MTAIRPAVPADASRIAEMIVVNYRTNLYPFFRNDAFYFKELNVLGIAADYADGSPSGCRTFVYDDGAVKGVINIRGDEVEKLYVEPQFQSQGIGAELMQFAIERFAVKWLWALEYNTRGIAFYARHGFLPNGETMIEDEWVPLVKLVRQEEEHA